MIIIGVMVQIAKRRQTTTRVRGVKGSKVLRTVKIQTSNYGEGMWNYFCDQTCLMRFIRTHYQEADYTQDQRRLKHRKK